MSQNSDQFGNLSGGEPSPTPMLPQTLNGVPAQTLTGAAANPNTAGIKPAILTQGASYSQDNASPVSLWQWSVARQNWYAVIS